MDQEERDTQRTDFLAQHGYTVLRFWDHEVLSSLDSVLNRILLALDSPSPHPSPSKEGEGELQ